MNPLASITRPAVAALLLLVPLGPALGQADVETGAVAPPGESSLWDVIASFGLNLTRGNNDTLLLNGKILAERILEEDELRLGADFQWSETENVQTSEQYHAFGQYNRLITDRFYIGIVGDFLRDEIADLDYRFSIAPTLGYYIVKTERTKLSVELGPAYNWEKQSGISDSYVSARAAERFTHRIGERSKLWQSIEYIPELGDLNNYILNAELGLSTRLTKRLSLETVARDTYDNAVPAGRKKNDLSFITSLAYALGEPDELAPLEDGTAGSLPPDAWNTTASLGLTLLKGNSDEMLFNGEITTTREQDGHIVTLDAGGAYGETAGTTNVQNLHAIADYKRLFENDRYYGGLNLAYFRDDIAEVDYRFTLAATLGHFCIRNEKTTFNVEAGPAYVFEKVANETDSYPGLRVAQAFEHKFSETFRVWESIEYVPELTEFSNYVITAEAGLETKISDRLSLKTYVQDVYDNVPAPGNTSNDLTFVTAISMSL